MNWWSVLKNDESFYMDETGAPMQSAQPQPPEQEESKPLYDQKQQLGIAHYLLDDVQQIAQLLRELHDTDGSADWERLLFDVERIKQILEDALTGGGPKPSGGGM
tara:strand:+ start:381 stop:695 length:315 start_codon:yes stop_codon:yes gene_type:complete